MSGVSKVLHTDHPAHGRWVAENVTRAIVAVQVSENSLLPRMWTRRSKRLRTSSIEYGATVKAREERQSVRRLGLMEV